MEPRRQRCLTNSDNETILSVIADIEMLDAETFSRSVESLESLVWPLQTSQLYAVVLHLQVTRWQNAEIFFLHHLSAWRAARNVFDLGCGPGAYLRFVQEYFPGKLYLGVDLNRDFCELASALTQCPIVCADLNEYRPDSASDFVLATNVFQHMSTYEGLLANLDSIVAPGGHMLISDTDPDEDEASQTEAPRVESLNRMYRALSAHEQGRRFSAWTFVEALTARGWTIVRRDRRGLVLSRLKEKLRFVKEELVRYLLIEKVFGPTVPKTTLHQELVSWLRAPRSFAPDLRGTVLVRRPD
jgi:SAM-dependent methyltransferase